MTKDKITLDAIRQDLKKIVLWQMSNKEEWRLSRIIPITLLAITLGLLLERVWVGVLVFLFATPHIIRYVIECKEYKAKKKAVLALIERGDVSISVERLSHIATETIYEPHSGRKSIHSTKTVKMYYFDGGAQWRLPVFDKHYEWSRELHLSTKGLFNTSVGGEEFFFVSLQGHYDVAYIYPCDLFELDSSLIQSL